MGRQGAPRSIVLRDAIKTLACFRMRSQQPLSPPPPPPRHMASCRPLFFCIESEVPGSGEVTAGGQACCLQA